jgi:hypothetical protein
MSLRSESERKLKEKDQEIAQLKEGADRETSVRRKQETRASSLEETHARAIEGKDKTIAALDASLASYRTKVETLQKKLDAVEIQRLNDLNAFDSRLREREQSDRAALDRATETQQRAVADLRAEMEGNIEEKDRLISEGRQNLDREAGERRRLSETLKRLQENADRAIAEKATALAAVEATLSSYKSKIETLQNRVDSLEQLRRTEQDQLTKQLSARQAIRSRVDEASHLAVDLDHSLDSIDASIAAIRDRARRLKSTLQEAETESEAAPEPSPLATASFAPEPEPEAEAARPALSQADVWDSLPPAPPPETGEQMSIETEPEPEPEPAPPTSGVPTWGPPKSNPYVEPLPETIVAEPSPEPSLVETEPIGRLDEPSGMIPAATPAPPAPASASNDEDLPLISPPDERDSNTVPPKEGEPPKRKKFSWQRK